MILLEIYENVERVGDAKVFALDPSMSVAMAKFTPTSAYDIDRHANVVDGEYRSTRGGCLRIQLPDGSPMPVSDIAIHDYPNLDEAEVHVLADTAESFAAMIAAYPELQAFF